MAIQKISLKCIGHINMTMNFTEERSNMKFEQEKGIGFIKKFLMMLKNI
jgi:hypothetical protein